MKLLYQGSGIPNPVDLDFVHLKIESMTGTAEAGNKQAKGYKSWDEFVKDIQIMWKNHDRLKPEKYEVKVANLRITIICF